MKSHPLLNFLRSLFSLRVQRLVKGSSPQSIGVQQPIGVQRFNYLEEQGIVTETIYPNQLGRVSYQASWWFAACPHNVVLLPGTPIRVLDRINIILIVEPLAPSNSQSNPSINAA
ncbi:NfeD family protein [Phormidesmis sp. 146-33]